jgi:hypothetical protein
MQPVKHFATKNCPLTEWFASKTHLKTIVDSPVHGGSGTTSQVNLSMDGIGKPQASFLWEKHSEDHFSPAPSKSASRRQFLSPKSSLLRRIIDSMWENAWRINRTSWTMIPIILFKVETTR